MGVISQLDGWKHSFLGVKAGASNVFEDSVLVYRTGFVIFIFFAFLCEKLLTVSSSGWTSHGGWCIEDCDCKNKTTLFPGS